MSFTNSVLMIRPANFGYNLETAINNAFQQKEDSASKIEIAEKARKEFDDLVSILRSEGVDVHVWNDSESPVKPDAVFPNNLFSTTPNGGLITYPMFAANRRIERDESILNYVEEQFEVERRYEMEHYEKEGQFLEGTGSIVFDHYNKVLFACLSPRTHIGLLDKIAVLLGYKMIAFNSVDSNGQSIYHTNVMMALGRHEVVVCLESITNEKEREELLNEILALGKHVIEISLSQVRAFAGNMIQLTDDQENDIWVMSTRAYRSLSKSQIERLTSSAKILHADIKTIESLGGGSTRCMIAEIFLSPRPAVT